MRAVHAVLCVLLLFFAALQYNDPDWLYWGLVYLVSAIWPFLAAVAPQHMTSPPLVGTGAAIALLSLIGFLSLAHQLGPGWIHNEEARESLGYLICALATALAVWDTRRRRASGARQGAA